MKSVCGPGFEYLSAMMVLALIQACARSSTSTGSPTRQSAFSPKSPHPMATSASKAAVYSRDRHCIRVSHSWIWSLACMMLSTLLTDRRTSLGGVITIRRHSRHPALHAASHTFCAPPPARPPTPVPVHADCARGSHPPSARASFLYALRAPQPPSQASCTFSAPLLARPLLPPCALLLVHLRPTFRPPSAQRAVLLPYMPLLAGVSISVACSLHECPRPPPDDSRPYIRRPFHLILVGPSAQEEFFVGGNISTQIFQLFLVITLPLTLATALTIPPVVRAIPQSAIHCLVLVNLHHSLFLPSAQLQLRHCRLYPSCYLPVHCGLLPAIGNCSLGIFKRDDAHRNTDNALLPLYCVVLEVDW
ncbi:hypothetical protein C8R44DRAFT_886073 [Mycena epipterygia]|nr:hypothetical protein C8R44DRAFT_886073 [Mycena epipterygia]